MLSARKTSLYSRNAYYLIAYERSRNISTHLKYSINSISTNALEDAVDDAGSVVDISNKVDLDYSAGVQASKQQTHVRGRVTNYENVEHSNRKVNGFQRESNISQSVNGQKRVNGADRIRNELKPSVVHKFPDFFANNTPKKDQSSVSNTSTENKLRSLEVTESFGFSTEKAKNIRSALSSKESNFKFSGTHLAQKLGGNSLNTNGTLNAALNLENPHNGSPFDSTDNSSKAQILRDVLSANKRNGPKISFNSVFKPVLQIESSNPQIEVNNNIEESKQLGIFAPFDSQNLSEKNDNLAKMDRRAAIDALTMLRKPKALHQKKLAKSTFENVDILVELPPNGLTVGALSNISGQKVDAILSKLAELGIDKSIISIESNIDCDTAELVCLEFEIQFKRLGRKDIDVSRTAVANLDDEQAAKLPSRAPVVSVMGHVDHGKTTLLDALRKTNMAEKEIAGITQRLGAFSVNLSKSDLPVTFFDTPGHAAFSAMRESAGRLTDIVVLVVAADDGLRAQTLEVLELLKQTPYIQTVVAMTKCDKEGIDKKEAARRIANQLLEHGIEVEEYGGTIPVVPISAKTGDGLEDLVEAILLQAELMELRSDVTAPGEGLVIDAGIEKGVGLYADVLVSWGSFRPGDACVVGTVSGRIKRLQGFDGKMMKVAKSSEAVRILGLKETPLAGDEVVVVEDDSKAAKIADLRRRTRTMRDMEIQQVKINEQKQLERALNKLKDPTKRRRKGRPWQTPEEREAAVQAATEAVAEAEALKEQQKDNCTYVPAVFKANGQGALAAMSAAVNSLPGRDEITVQVAHGGVGPVTTGDVERAAAAGAAPIYAYGLGSTAGDVASTARALGVNIVRHDVIYRFQEDVASMLTERLPLRVTAVPLARAEVLQVFHINVKGSRAGQMIAGCRVTVGDIKSSHAFRVLRNGEVLHKASRGGLRHFKDKVNEVRKGQECGIALEGFTDFKEGDVVETFEVHREKRKLGDPL